MVSVLVLTLANVSTFSPSFGHSRTVSPFGDFKNIPPVVLQTQTGKQFKIDIDVLSNSGHSDESYTAVNHRARGHDVQLKRGEEVSVAYGQPFGTTDYVSASLLKGKINIKEGPNGFITLTGQNIVFLHDYDGQGSSHGQIPTTVKKGNYKLVILITYNEEMSGYYITNALIR